MSTKIYLNIYLKNRAGITCARMRAHVRPSCLHFVTTSRARKDEAAEGLGAIPALIEFLPRYRHVDQAALARFTTASDRSAVVQRRSTLRRRDRSCRSRSGASGLGKCANRSNGENVTSSLYTFPHLSREIMCGCRGTSTSRSGRQ